MLAAPSLPMAAPVDIQEDLVLQAAEHCRALRQALVARPATTQRSRSSGLKKQQRHLEGSEQRLLMREQQELLEEQKRELHEQKADLLEKDEQLRRQRQQLDESRLYGDRCEQLAELRAKERLEPWPLLCNVLKVFGWESSVDSFSEQQRSYENCLRSWSAERLRVQSLQAELAAFDSRHSRELQELKAKTGSSVAKSHRSVLWGSVPLRPNLEDMWVQTSGDVVDKDLHTETVQELRSQQLQSQLEATREQEALLEKLQSLENVQEKLEHAEWKLETPEYVLHGELQQAYASLRDRESEVRMEKDRGEAISRAAEQRVELLRTQTQALMEQTRIQASQAAFEYSQEQQRTENLDEELAESAAQIRGVQEELLASRTELQLVSAEADHEQRNLRSALGEQLLECEQHCTRLTCDRQQQESVAAWLQDSWRRSFGTTEVAFARAEVATWKKETQELTAKLEKQEQWALQEEAAMEEASSARKRATTEAEGGKPSQQAEETLSLAKELQELRSEAALLRSSLTVARLEVAQPVKPAMPSSGLAAIISAAEETLHHPLPLADKALREVFVAGIPRSPRVQPVFLLHPWRRYTPGQDQSPTRWFCEDHPYKISTWTRSSHFASAFGQSELHGLCMPDEATLMLLGCRQRRNESQVSFNQASDGTSAPPRLAALARTSCSRRPEETTSRGASNPPGFFCAVLGLRDYGRIMLRAVWV
ncbi:hypothetical protein AK812_SmicGene20759 [Symbiodinium microadriaticum]|uniref:Uncharacterized protein n=1 Tax=Symbiodinium microadriaticum TaxID=2951 RepID=A0A1Q9DP57_SYMMI|nr:hypothetical protein AK812_SmicGene20759 [Symbiodinium microadriaticum]